MREIKYRAWDEVREEFIYSDKVAGGMWRFFKTLEDRGIRHYETDDYTGLKDKNGVEIYEGDIVTHPLCVKEPHDENEPCESFVGRINYETDRGQYLAVNTKRNGYVVVLTEAYKFEVIGNIYENKELLKED